MEFISKHKLMTAIIVIVIIAIAWWEFTHSSSAAAPVLSDSATAADAGTDTNSQDQTIVSTLLQLQAVSLNGTILTDPGFLALQDFTTQIVSEPIGRADPFAPVAPGAKISTSTGIANPNLFAPKQ